MVDCTLYDHLAHAPNPPATAPKSPGSKKTLGKKKPNFYTPVAIIRRVPGVRRRQIDDYTDSFVGTGTDLAATGLLTLDMLPGKPGRAAMSVCYRARGQAGSSHPGRLDIFAIGEGRFRVVLRVSKDECGARKAARETAEALRYEASPPAAYPTAAATDHIELILAFAAEIRRVLGDDEADRYLAAKAIAEARSLPRQSHLRLVWSAP